MKIGRVNLQVREGILEDTRKVEEEDVGGAIGLLVELVQGDVRLLGTSRIVKAHHIERVPEDIGLHPPENDLKIGIGMLAIGEEEAVAHILRAHVIIEGQIL